MFFGERGANNFKGYGVMDFAATYNIAVWRSLRPWFKVEVYNLLNNPKQIAWDRTVTANPPSPLDANGIPTDYIEGPRFGQATSGATSRSRIPPERRPRVPHGVRRALLIGLQAPGSGLRAYRNRGRCPEPISTRSNPFTSRRSEHEIRGS